MGDVIEYCIVLAIEEFKKTLENARPARVLKAGSKSCKMNLKRPIQNIKAYESAISQFENIVVKYPREVISDFLRKCQNVRNYI